MNTISSASISGMVVSLILCVAAPVALCVLLKRKTGAKLSDMFLGVVIFILFARFLEQLLHMAMLSAFGERLTGNLWLSALYGGAAAAVFEEFGRLIAMKYLLDNQLEKDTALMYGVGHGGIEALTIGALTCVSNLATVSMINGGKLESALAGLDEAARATTMATVSQLWTLPSYLFYMVGVERLIAFALQICLSYLVYRAVRYHRRGFFLAAMGIHFAVDALAALLKDAVPIPALEAISDWTADAIHDTLIDLAAKLEVKNATLMWPVRIAAAGKLVTPGGAVEICHLLGKDETLRRLCLGLAKLN